MPSTRARCLKCGQLFRRLDTHLRVSATCRDIQGRTECLPAPPSKSMNTISSTANSNSTASCSLNGNLNSMATTTAVATINWTLKKKPQAQCPSSNRLFKRLDTHLRVSATCRVINPVPPVPATSVCGPTQAHQDQALREDAMFYSLQDSNFAAAPNAPTQTTSTTHTASHQGLEIKATLILPTSSEEWEQANSFFETNLVPAALAATSPEEMSGVLLSDGIYSYFALTYGTKSPTQRKKRRSPHNRSLKEVERQKREAKKELRLAKRNEASTESVQSLARHFLSLIRAHSRLKKAANARLLSRDARSARARCHKRFRECAREVLDGERAQPIPSFSEAAATSFFSDIHHSSAQNLSGCQHPLHLRWS